MAPWATVTLAGVGLAGGGLGLALWFSSARWKAQTSQFIETLSQAALPRDVKRLTFKDFE